MLLLMLSHAVSCLVVLIAYLCFVWIVHKMYSERWSEKERRNVKKAELHSCFAAWFPGWYYLFNGPDILLRNYSSGTPLAIRTPETHYIHFSADHIQELKDAPDEKLSLHALSNDMFYPEKLMNGLQVKDKMFDNGTIHTRVFRVVLPSHLPSLAPALAHTIASNFDTAISNAPHQEDWKELPIFSLTKRVITAANATVFFGPTLANDETFLDASLAYIEELFTCAEVLRLTPSFMHPLITPILMQYHGSLQVMVQYLAPIVQERLTQKHSTHTATTAATSQEPVDCIQLFVDANARKEGWNVDKIVQVLIGTWFAAVHQPALSLVYALHDLCDHPEYISLLRKETSSIYKTDDTRRATAGDIDRLPLLDAFIKESCRLNPSDSISVRRKVLNPFTFSDGTHILPGDVACVPLQALMRDEHLHPSPLSFSPSRFIAKESSDGALPTQTKRFTHADSAYPLWGLGKHSCPGRYLASLVLKLCLAHVVTNYDTVALMDKTSRTFYFRSAIIPKAKTSMRFRPRHVSSSLMQ